MLAILLSVGLTACGTQQEQRGKAPTRTTGTSLDTRKTGARISPLLSANFSLLRAAPDPVPLAIRQALTGSVPSISWKLARRIPVTFPSTYWLVPGIADVCVVVKTPGSPAVGAVCATVTQALNHGIASTTLDPNSGSRVIVGAVPTGTRTVIVRSGAQTSSVRALHGRFALRDSVSAPPDVLMLR